MGIGSATANILDQVTGAIPRVQQYVSCSQVDTFDLCPMKWYSDTILGLPRKTSAATDLGGVVHKALEQLMVKGTMPAGVAPQVENLVKSALPMLPKPGTVPGDRVEYKFVIEPEVFKLPFLGAIDLLDEPLITDYKTTSAWKYAKTADELQVNTQAIVYGVVGGATYERTHRHIARPPLEVRGEKYEWQGFVYPSGATFRHVQMITKGPAEAREARAELNHGDLTRGVKRIQQTVNSMVDLGQVTDVQLIPKNTQACFAYGGCPRRELCAAISEVKGKIEVANPNPFVAAVLPVAPGLTQGQNQVLAQAKTMAEAWSASNCTREQTEQGFYNWLESQVRPENRPPPAKIVEVFDVYWPPIPNPPAPVELPTPHVPPMTPPPAPSAPPAPGAAQVPSIPAPVQADPINPPDVNRGGVEETEVVDDGGAKVIPSEPRFGPWAARVYTSIRANECADLLSFLKATLPEPVFQALIKQQPVDGKRMSVLNFAKLAVAWMVRSGFQPGQAPSIPAPAPSAPSAPSIPKVEAKEEPKVEPKEAKAAEPKVEAVVEVVKEEPKEAKVEPKAKGPVLYVDCRPRNVEVVDLSTFLVPYQEAYCKSSKEQAQHYATPAYNDGARNIAGRLLVDIRSGVKLPARLFCDTRLPLTNHVLEVLLPIASGIVEAIR